MGSRCRTAGAGSGTSIRVRSSGSEISSIFRPTSTGSTSYWLPCKDTVAVLVTARSCDHRNASRSSAGVGSVGAPAASNRASSVRRDGLLIDRLPQKQRSLDIRRPAHHLR